MALAPFVGVTEVAERVGFEPTVRFPARSLSRRVLSTAQSPLRGRCRLNRSRAGQGSAMSNESSIKDHLKRGITSCHAKLNAPRKMIALMIVHPPRDMSINPPPLFPDTKISARGRRTVTVI